MERSALCSALASLTPQLLNISGPSRGRHRAFRAQCRAAIAAAPCRQAAEGGQLGPRGRQAGRAASSVRGDMPVVVPVARASWRDVELLGDLPNAPVLAPPSYTSLVQYYPTVV